MRLEEGLKLSGVEVMLLAITLVINMRSLSDIRGICPNFALTQYNVNPYILLCELEAKTKRNRFRLTEAI